MKFDVGFSTKAKTVSGENVFIVGDCKELGNWDPRNAKPLFLDHTDDEGFEVWACTLKLSVEEDIQYRYLIGHLCHTDDEGETHDVMVRVWETNIIPRHFSMRAYCMNPQICMTTDSTFGYYDGKKSIDKGWLTGQTEIHMRLFNDPIQMWKRKSKDVVYRVKCTTIDLRYKDSGFMETEDEESSHELIAANVANQVEVSILNGEEDHPHPQSQFGSQFNEHSYMVFRAQTVEPEFMGYKFDLYAQHPSADASDIPRHVGTSYILPVNLEETCGIKTVQINGSKHLPIGQLKVEYLLVKSMRNQLCDAKVTYATYWKHKRRALDVGHRGMGSSHCPHPKECAAVRENTIASLSEAGGHGADYVEFDVQLSKDKVPVIYHDLSVCLTLKQKEGMQHQLFVIPVKDLNMNQLQALHVHHKSEVTKGYHPEDSPPMTNDPVEQQPFPTLKQCLEMLDPHIGFNVEIKYQMQLKTGEMEEDVTQTTEKNEYVDKILEVILQYAGPRRVVFSSFNPDICILIRRKQNRYPVMFLCNGDMVKYAPYKDERCWTVKASAHFCHCEKLLGISPGSDALLRDPSSIAMLKELGLIIFCWGETNNNVDNIRKLKAMGLDAVIYDRINELKAEKQNIFMMESTIKMDLLTKMGLIDNGTQVRNKIQKMQSVDVQMDTSVDFEVLRRHRLAST